MALNINNPTRVLSAALAAGLLSTSIHAAPPGQRSLSTVCGVAIPVPIEEATKEYLAPLTAMGGDTQPLCNMWKDFNPTNAGELKAMKLWEGTTDAHLNLWKAVAGAHLLHTVKDQKTVQPYRKALAELFWNRKPRELNSVDKTMAAAFSNITENAALGANENPKDFAMRLDAKSPKVAATLRTYFDKHPPGPD